MSKYKNSGLCKGLIPTATNESAQSSEFETVLIVHLDNHKCAKIFCEAGMFSRSNQDLSRFHEGSREIFLRTHLRVLSGRMIFLLPLIDKVLAYLAPY